MNKFKSIHELDAFLEMPHKLAKRLKKSAVNKLITVPCELEYLARDAMGRNLEMFKGYTLKVIQ